MDSELTRPTGTRQGFPSGGRHDVPRPAAPPHRALLETAKKERTTKKKDTIAKPANLYMDMDNSGYAPEDIRVLKLGYRPPAPFLGELDTLDTPEGDGTTPTESRRRQAGTETGTDRLDSLEEHNSDAYVTGEMMLPIVYCSPCSL